VKSSLFSFYSKFLFTKSRVDCIDKIARYICTFLSYHTLLICKGSTNPGRGRFRSKSQLSNNPFSVGDTNRKSDNILSIWHTPAAFVNIQKPWYATVGLSVLFWMKSNGNHLFAEKITSQHFVMHSQPISLFARSSKIRFVIILPSLEIKKYEFLKIFYDQSQVQWIHNTKINAWNDQIHWFLQKNVSFSEIKLSFRILMFANK